MDGLFGKCAFLRRLFHCGEDVSAGEAAAAAVALHMYLNEDNAVHDIESGIITIRRRHYETI